MSRGFNFKKHFLMPLVLVPTIMTGCVGSTSLSKNTEELTDKVNKSDLSAIEITSPDYREKSPKNSVVDFSLKLFDEEADEKNMLISPLSIISALGMTGNGAEDNTLYEMEKVLGTDISVLNDYIKAYMSMMPNDEKYHFSSANSIWIRDDEKLSVKDKFLQKCRDYYNANVFKAPFDSSTKNDINKWVDNKTDGMIEDILNDDISKDTIMYLINAISFDSEWDNIYTKDQIHSGDFISIDGEKQDSKFMWSQEYGYLENDSTVGFVKPYKDDKYEFVAIVPKDNKSMEEFIEGLNGKDLMKLLEDKEECSVEVCIPKFSCEYETEFSKRLKSLGMKDAFDSQNAAFKSLATSDSGNIYISRVIHKTKIDVNERGTKAGAATAVELKCESANEDIKEVKLNRPFFYMIVDTEEHFPIFMGSVVSMKQ